MGGLFSAPTRTVVGTAAYRLIDDSQNDFQAALITAILKNESIVDNLMGSLQIGVGARMGSVYNYAKNFYALEFPQGQISEVSNVSKEDIGLLIKAELSHPDDILVTERHFTVYTPVVEILDFLIDNRGYDINSNELAEGSWPPGLAFDWVDPGDGGDLIDPTTLIRFVSLNHARQGEDGFGIVAEYDLWIYRPVWHSPYTEWDGDAEIYYSGYMTEEWHKQKTFEETVPVTITVNAFDFPCVVALYYRLDDQDEIIGNLDVWTYDIRDGTYPQLDPVLNPANDEFLPVVPIRYGNRDLTSEFYHNTDLYKTSKRMLKLIQLDYDALGESINANPQTGDIDHAYVMWGANIQSDRSETMTYLADFFETIEANQVVNRTTFFAGLPDPTIDSDAPNDYHQISDSGLLTTEFSLTEHGLNLHIKYDFIDVTYEAGVVGDGSIGNIRKDYGTYYVDVTKTIFNGAGIPDWGDDPPPEGMTIVEREKRYYVVFTSQTGTGLVRKVAIYNLQTHNYIYDGVGQIGQRGKAVETRLEDVIFDQTNTNLIIPLQYNLSHSYDLADRNALYADCTIIVLNSYKRSKLAWYTASWFKFVVLVVVMVITVFSGQYYLPGLVAAYGGYVALAIVIALTIAMQFTFKRIVELYGEKVGIIGAIVLTVVAMILTRGAATGAISKFWMTAASHILQAGMILISETNQFLIEEGVEIQKEGEAELEEIAQATAELETIKEDLLGVDGDLNPLLYKDRKRFRTVPNENWDTLRQRTLGLAQNTMWTIHGEIQGFHDRLLTLDRGLDPHAYAV